jgi:hypothetical protein
VAEVTFWNQNRSENIAEESQTTTNTCWGNVKKKKTTLKTVGIITVQFF